MFRRNLYALCFLIAAVAWGATRMTQVTLLNSTITTSTITTSAMTSSTIDSTPIGATTPANGNFTNVGISSNLNVSGIETINDSEIQQIVANPNGIGGGWAALPGITVGANLSANQSGALEETDFINQRGTGVGGFIWYNVNTSTLAGASALMQLYNTGLLVAAGFQGAFTGNLTGNGTGTWNGPVNGNASTATALQSTPTNCSSPQTSTGIAANGNANCNANIEQMGSTTNVCTTSNSAWSICGGYPTNNTITWPVAFATSTYPVTCQAVNPTSTSSTATVLIYVTARTTSNIGFTIQNGDTTSAGSTTVSEVDCIARGPHA